MAKLFGVDLGDEREKTENNTNIVNEWMKNRERESFNEQKFFNMLYFYHSINSVEHLRHTHHWTNKEATKESSNQVMGGW